MNSKREGRAGKVQDVNFINEVTDILECQEILSDNLHSIIHIYLYISVLYFLTQHTYLKYDPATNIFNFKGLSFFYIKHTP
jgi:uncharacterized sporulation protein YeaH/YhbH (DUF444 family)